MSEPGRMRFVLEVIDALSDPILTMSEGRHAVEMRTDGHEASGPVVVGSSEFAA